MDGTLRRLAIPHDHIQAEVAAFPFATEEAFRNGLIELDPRLDRNRDTEKLWRAAERSLIHSFPSMSLDDLTNLRDWLWFDGSPEGYRRPVSLHRYARRVTEIWSGRNLDGAERSPRSDVSRRRRDRWFAFALPREVLEAPESSALSPMLERLLAEERFAETHLHLGVGIEFGLLWAAAARSVAVEGLREDGFKAPGAAFDEGARMAAWLLRAMCARYLLAAYLARARRCEGFRSWLARKVLTRLGARFELLLDVLRELRVGRESPDFRFHDVRALYNDLIGASTKRRYDTRQEVIDDDPVASVFSGRQNFPDLRLHSEARAYLDRLDGAGLDEEDEDFERLYWQVVRIQAIFYRHVVQRPMTPGLMWFIRTYSRSGPARSMLSWRLLLEEARRASGEGRGLCSLEVRTAPAEDVGQNLELVKAIANLAWSVSCSMTENDWPQNPELVQAIAALTGYRPGSTPPHNTEYRARGVAEGQSCEFGLVLHFAKRRGGGCVEGRPNAFWQKTEAMPEIDVGYRRCRYASYYRDQRKRAMAVGDLLWRYPWSLQIVRGLDCCTDEQGVPTWVLAPLFSYLRAVDEKVRGELKRDDVHIPPLGVTAHVGEDFVYLTSGLRRIGEALTHFQFKEGDRIGHGMALGIDAEIWARESGPVLMAREDRLFDLVWERSLLLTDVTGEPTNRLSRIEHLIREQFSRVFPEHGADIDIVQRFVDFLHDGEELERAGFPNRPGGQSAGLGGRVDWKARQVLMAYLTDAAVFQRCRELVVVDPVPEIQAMQALQFQLRGQLGRLGIPVEVNPSSNLLIGNLGRMEDHPMFRLSPLRNMKREATSEEACPELPPVSVCVGSDDPLVFACDLPRELMLLHDTLISNAVAQEDAIRWIQDAMRVGRLCRFTRPLGAPLDCSHNNLGADCELAPVP